jgi:hypothetical protein
MNLLQQRKLAFACASAEFIKVGRILRRLLHNLEKWEHEEEHALVQGHIGQLLSITSFLLARPITESHSWPRMAGWHNGDTIRFGTMSWCWKARPVRENSVEHEPLSTYVGSDVL